MSKKVYAPDGRRLVFRVEDMQGVGPYRALVEGEDGACRSLSGLLLKSYLDDSKHPTPGLDRGLSDFWEYNPTIREEYLFGFRDLDQLTNWFMWPRRMHWCRHFARIAVYAVDTEEDPDNVVDGQFQTIFHKAAAERIATLPLTTTYYNPETGEHHAN